MLINISEKPVFYKENGKLFGILKGFVIYKENLTFLYCKSQEKYVYIPIEDAIIGEDAIMLKNSYNETLLSASLKPEVYTLEGKKLGTLLSLELNNDFQVTAIHTENHCIKKGDILHMDHIIIVKPLENNLPDISLPLPSDDIDLYESIQISESEENIQNIEKSENQLLDIDETIEKKEIDNNIDPRYKYLLGKKLLKDIVILDKTFSRGTAINGDLIEFALNNNSIVKVIMHSED